MKKGSTLFLKIALLVIVCGALALCFFILPVPLLDEGFGMYDPIVIVMYLAAVPFFISLYQSLQLLNLIDKKNPFSLASVKALKYIKYCAIAILALYIAGMPYIYIVADKDGAPGGLAIGLVIVFASAVIATFAAVLQKLLQNVIDIKSENELTV
ncbi:MAG: hypothetical protein A2928_04060 [Candidatus Taylorbacteria bacterium RIFCSPLOWO2_01_FULL_45_15b]|uniref:DUF2975 domain-containing protein n=1 Tax=Candidatus Taylorbacteria bacterium RIFCSPLOWO2_01_FULL_45_15b TaxID=1802319 RepID=A0A1G2NG44_9BACT|nr:MAG: hypothetical protein A2928_04060 [Candidatus Taylorbacteria bacterium RIFCSPLOWO2_01_FULL_45_15b]